MPSWHNPVAEMVAMNRQGYSPPFQPRVVCEGKSTENIGPFTRIINEAHEESIREAREKSKEKAAGRGAYIEIQAKGLASVPSFNANKKGIKR